MDINESRAAGARIILSMLCVVFGLILYVTTFGIYYSDSTTVLILVVFGLLFAGGLSAMVINAVTFVRAGRSRERPLVRVESAVKDAGVRLIVRDGRMIKIGRYSFERRQWRSLAVALADVNWSWSRRKVERAGIFTSLTEQWPEIEEEFRRMGFVHGEGRGKKVTEQGRERMCDAAGLDRII